MLEALANPVSFSGDKKVKEATILPINPPIQQPQKLQDKTPTEKPSSNIAQVLWPEKNPLSAGIWPASHETENAHERACLTHNAFNSFAWS